MESNSIRDLFINASNAFAYGDQFAGDMLMMQCLRILDKRFVEPSLRTKILSTVHEINVARERHDFTAIADILRYEALPILEIKN